MLITKRASLGQSITEYALLIGIVVAALAGTQTYMKRGIQGVIKVAADELGLQKDAEEIDIQKGAKSESKVRRVTRGKTPGSAEVPELSEGESQRLRTSADGSQRKDRYTLSEVRPLCDQAGCASSYSRFVSESER